MATRSPKDLDISWTDGALKMTNDLQTPSGGSAGIVTVREYLVDHLTGNGLWDDESVQVLDLFVESDTSADFGKVLQQSVDDYPESMMAILLLSLNRSAVKWIDQNKPEHFAENMFTA